MSKKCSLLRVKWNSDEIYLTVGPYAMNRSVINKMGNPISTNEKMEWIFAYSNGSLVAFCAMECTKTSIYIKNYYAIDGDQDWFFFFIENIKEFFEVSFRTKLFCYVKTNQLEKTLKLGFKPTTPGKNWHRLIIEKQS